MSENGSLGPPVAPLRGVPRTLVKLGPATALVAGYIAASLTDEHTHVALILAVAPCLAAVVYGTVGTTVMGVLATAAFASLVYQVTPGRFDVFVLKLILTAVVSAFAVFASRAFRRVRAMEAACLIGSALQERLLPRIESDHSAVEVTSRYLPADSEYAVSGDWFDVIGLSGARVALVVGDVVGHGIGAAATMGQLRAAIATFAALDLEPAELLVHLDDVVARMAEQTPGETIGTSCLYMVYDPVSRRCTTALAGHPPPVVVDPTGHAAPVPAPTNPPLGLGDTPYESLETELAEGSLIVLYTDGLLNLHRSDPDAALETLCEVVRGKGRTIEQTASAVVHRMLRGKPEDDVVLLLARTRALLPDRVASWKLPADPSVVPRAREDVTRQLDAWGLTAHSFVTELIASELLTNALRYASAPIQLRLIYNKSLICEVSDTSSTSPHLRRASPTDEEGRGLYLVARLATRWGTRHTETGKTIWTEQRLDTPADVPIPTL